MLKTLNALFDGLFAPQRGAGAAPEEHTLQLATAVMLIEVMRADATFDASERAAVRTALCDKFALTQDEAQQLALLAETTAQTSTDLFAFTSRINAHFDMTRKLRMVEHMWHVAYADGRLSEHERHVLWRVADLLHVPHGAYINARMRAERLAGAG